MYKVVVADDEINLLEGIKEFIDWQALNAEIVFTASNGYEVKEYLCENSADILITDIRMPGMDGIELAEWIYKNKIRTKIIFLTAYPDFQYMKKGLKYDITAYVLKDDYIDELEPIIKDVISKLHIQGSKLNEYVDRFILKRASDDDREKFNSLWQINMYICLLIKLSGNNRFNFSEIVTSLAYESFKNDGIIVNSLSNFEHLCLLSADTENIKSKCEKLVLNIEKGRSVNCKIGISGKRDDIMLLNEGLIEADDAVNNIDTHGIMFYESIKQARLSKKACAIIEKSYDEAISLSKVAGELNVSTSYLSRKFSDEQGITITEYINKIRIKNAVKLIESTDMLVYEIAERVGINDPAYFTNIFKKYMGISPQKYKKEFLK